MRVTVALAVLGLLASAGVGAQDPGPAFTAAFTLTPAEVETALYFHPLNPFEMPINTQQPQYGSTWQPTAAAGAGATTLTCLDPVAGDLPQGTTGMEWHTYYGYSTPSFLEYQPDGNVRMHPVRALAYDVPLVGDGSVLHWYLAESAPAQGLREAAPLANVQVRVTMRAGDAITLDGAGYDEGPILMEGATAPVTAFAGQVTGEGAAQVTANDVGGRWVYDFAVPLQRQGDTIPRATGFNVRVEALLANPACESGGGSLMPGTVTAFAGPDHQPRLLLRHAHPLRLAYLHPQLVDDRLVVHTSIESPWGNYDVLASEAKLHLYGPVEVTTNLEQTVQRTTEHYHLLDAVDQTWAVDVADLPDGRYTAVYSVQNLQRTTTAETSLGFHVQDGRLYAAAPEPRQAPGLALVGVLAALALAFALRRARRPGPPPH